MKKTTMKFKNLYKNKFMEIFNLFAGGASILSLFGISLSWIFTSEIWNRFSWIIKIIIFLLIVKSIISLSTNWKEEYEEYMVKKDFEKITSNKNLEKISLALPKTSTLKMMSRQAEKRAKNWDPESQLKSINIYFRYKDGCWQIPSLQAIYISHWKQEKAYFYEGLSKGESIKELTRYNSQLYERNVKAFHEHKYWQKKVEKVFNKVSSIVKEELSIAIHELNHGYSLDITYYQGRVERKKSFELNQNFELLES